LSAVQSCPGLAAPRDMTRSRAVARTAPAKSAIWSPAHDAERCHDDQREAPGCGEATGAVHVGKLVGVSAGDNWTTWNQLHAMYETVTQRNDNVNYERDYYCHYPRAGCMKRYCVRPSVRPQQQIRCCGFAAVRPAGRTYRSIAAAWSAACECGQCHVVSVRTELLSVALSCRL